MSNYDLEPPVSIMRLKDPRPIAEVQRDWNRFRQEARAMGVRVPDFLREDALASQIAVLLRDHKDLDAAHRNVTRALGQNAIIDLAFRYERARRKAYPNPRGFPPVSPR